MSITVTQLVAGRNGEGATFKLSVLPEDAPSFESKDPAVILAAASAAVNAERDRRLYTVFTFQGKEYDCDHVSLARITGAATLAGFAIGAGAPEGYVRWHGGDTDFMWIAHDNSLTTMDAQTAFAFGQAAAENQSAHVFAADMLKRQNPIPADYTDDRHWP